MKEYTEEELYSIKLRILNREICICKTCDTFFDYIPQKKFCNECIKERRKNQALSSHSISKQRIRDKKRTSRRTIIRILDK